MSSLQALKSRMKSIRSTHKVTRAMRMIAASRLRRAHSKADAANFYIEDFENLFAALYEAKPAEICNTMLSFGYGKIEKDDPLDKRKKARLWILLSSHRGLCGQFNTSIIKKLKSTIALSKSNKEEKEFQEIVLCVGKRGFNIAKTWQNISLVEYFEDSDLNIKTIDIFDAELILKKVLTFTEDYQIVECRALHNKFISVLNYDSVDTQIWPLENKEDFSQKLIHMENKGQSIGLYNYDPDLQNVIEYTCLNYIKTQIYKIVLSRI